MAAGSGANEVHAPRTSRRDLGLKSREGIHLYQFHLRAVRYGSQELSASSPDVTLAALRFRMGTRFIYEYDLNIPLRHAMRIEDQLEPEARKTYPACTGDGACPPEDCDCPESLMDGRNDRFFV